MTYPLAIADTYSYNRDVDLRWICTADFHVSKQGTHGVARGAFDTAVCGTQTHKPIRRRDGFASQLA